MLGIAERLEHRPNELSGGEQQRVALAALLSTAPRSCSPTSPPATWIRKARTSFSTCWRQSNQNLGQTVLMITHNPEAAAYGDRIVHMRDGQIVTPEEDPQWSPINQRITYGPEPILNDTSWVPFIDSGRARFCETVRTR